MENTKKVKFGETGPRYDQKFVWSDNFGQNIWNKVKKPNKFGQHWKTLVSIFCILIDCYSKRLMSGRDTRHWAKSPPNYMIFSTLRTFLRFYFLSCSASCKAVCLPGLLYQKSRFVLLVANQNCARTL